MEGRKFLQNSWKQHRKEEGPVGVGAAVEAQWCGSFSPPQLTVPRFSPRNALPGMGSGGNEALSPVPDALPGFSGAVSGSRLLSVQHPLAPLRHFPTFIPSPALPEMGSGRIPAVAHLHSASSPAGPAPPSRTSAAPGRAACGAGAAPPRPPRLRGYTIVLAIFSSSPFPSSSSRSGGARRQRSGPRDTGGTRPPRAAGAAGSALSVAAVRRPSSAGRRLWRTAVRPGGAGGVPAASPAARGRGTPRTETSRLPVSAGRG